MRLRLVLLCLSLCLASCGWQLRGQGPSRANLQSLSGVYLQAAPGNPVATALQRQLKLEQIALLDKSQANSLTIELKNPQTDRRVQTLGGDLRARQIRLEMDVDFSILDNQGKALTSSTMQAVRTYDQNPLQPATSGRQEEQLQSEMADQIAADLILLLPQYLSSTHENQG